MKAMWKEVALKLSTKPTIPIHVLGGVITIFGAIHFGWWVAPICVFIFLVIQIWTKKEWATSQDDFWEYAFGIFATLGILLAIFLKAFLVVALLFLLVWVVLEINKRR